MRSADNNNNNKWLRLSCSDARWDSQQIGCKPRFIISSSYMQEFSVISSSFALMFARRHNSCEFSQSAVSSRNVSSHFEHLIRDVSSLTQTKHRRVQSAVPHASPITHIHTHPPTSYILRSTKIENRCRFLSWHLSLRNVRTDSSRRCKNVIKIWVDVHVHSLASY